MTKRECPRCYAVTETIVQKLVASYVRREVDGETRRVYCPHYQNSAVTPAAYEIALSMDDVFKDKFSCAYCPFRIVELTGGFFCLYDQMDPTQRNLYYLEPEPGNKLEQPTRQLSVAYWRCKNCHSMIEVSRTDRAL